MKIGDLVREQYSKELCIIVEVVADEVAVVEETMFLVHFCAAGDREIAWAFDLQPLDGEYLIKK